jgi:hypothetical protein
MARKKLQVKDTKKPTLRKKLEVKKDAFAKRAFYFSSTLITDNHSIILILSDTEEFLKRQKNINVETSNFNWEDVDLQLEFNRKEQLDIDDDGMIESMGKIDQYNWLKQVFPSCVFHQITKWLGKRVNTLVIVLAEENGKPVAIVKTIE